MASSISPSGNMIHFAVEQVGLSYSLDLYLLLDPLSALLGDFFLLELIGELQSVSFNDKGLLFGFAGIEAIDKRWLTEEELKPFDFIEPLFECIVGVDREISRRNRKTRTVAYLRH